ANEARQTIVSKLQREIRAEETLANQLLYNLNRYSEEMLIRDVQITSNPEQVRLNVLTKLQEAIEEEAILEEQILALMHRFADSVARFAAGFTGSVTALSAVCLFYAAGNMFYSSVALRWDMAQRMVNAVHDWSTVKTVLDVGCGRGILLNTVAMQLKKEGSSGRVVGLDRKNTTLSTLRTAGN
ncbi:methyltransferase type 11, partial [Tanacetum coccineum]